jgi:hypothetical protein
MAEIEIWRIMVPGPGQPWQKRSQDPISREKKLGVWLIPGISATVGSTK